MIRRVFVEKQPGFRQEAEALREDLRGHLELPHLEGLRLLLRYDVEGLAAPAWEAAVRTVFSEPQVDVVYAETVAWAPDEHVFAVEYLPGQFDQRADSAAQCIQILAKEKPPVATATVYALRGPLKPDELERIKRYLINPVDSREASLDKPTTLSPVIPEPASVPSLKGFIGSDALALQKLHDRLGLAMSLRDLEFCQTYFRDTERRDPTVTELKLLDTYWSDHCRHTTFLTEISEVLIDDSPLTAAVDAAWKRYLQTREELYGPKLAEKPVCLMDLATLAMKDLRRRGLLPDLEVSEEINAASIIVPAVIDGRTEEWLVMFKNETHNHPTEIEPFGGAATCLGGAIRDPLSGRSYVYQAMRVTGAADPRQAVKDTLPGKLPQRKITLEAARGYSSYGNQIGLATGLVREMYHPDYVAKRLEVGAVIGAAPRDRVRREEPQPGDVILLVGGRTGRDGIGGATGSSKAHTHEALQNSAEVQKGDAPTERKLQRLFRRPEAARLIKRCNDFGAGGVSVAIGELAPSLRVHLDRVPKKYDGLDGTELALSESQERMAVVLAPSDVEAFLRHVAEENLEGTLVAEVTDSGRLQMDWRGQRLVDIARNFLDTNGVRPRTRARVTAPLSADNPLTQSPQVSSLKSHLAQVLADLNVCSQKGLGERFDSSIGANTLLSPFGGKYQLTPAEAMAARLPAEQGTSATATLMSFGFHPELSKWSPFHGGVYAIVEAVARLVASGGELERIRLTLQEYFERLREDPTRWGKPLAALLGAFHAQEALGLAAVGGKDSMSGSFKDLDVPPTLVAFAVAPVEATQVISPELKQAGHRLVRVPLVRATDSLPDFAALKERYAQVTRLIHARQVVSARVLRTGGLAAALAEMAFGNHLGVRLGAQSPEQLFGLALGDLVLEVLPQADLGSLPHELLGEVTSEPFFQVGEERLPLAELRVAWESPLEDVFPTRAPGEHVQPLNLPTAGTPPRRRAPRLAQPRVLIPVFPGTNCEYDTARAFERAGAQVRTLVFRNLDAAAVDASLAALAAGIREAQILAMPGGFSAGDEPAGSGKFIASVLRNSAVKDAVHDLIHTRDGLVLGICNGFQALIKVGLVPYGEIRDPQPGDPTLTHNRIGRHVSCYAHTRVVSNRSPWLANLAVGDIHTLPVSHGEGRFYADAATAQQLFAREQVACVYVDADGHPSGEIVHNPNGSVGAIEAITSPCGRVLGKMAHTERTGPDLACNIPGNKHQPIFAAGVDYFRA